MGLLALLMLFEFIAMVIHPYIEEWTHDIPVLMLLVLVAVASLLVPLHHKLEHWVKEKVGIKLQAQLLSAVQSVGGGFYFGTGGSGGAVMAQSSMYQFELGGGLVFKMGE